jgi:4-diphosphocytidyl-2-C-methyl-D-erythritol kinase
MTKLFKIKAPAKLNLFLHVVGRRPDGYHLLQSVFQLIDLCDEISLSVRDDGVIHRANPIPGVDPLSDLSTKAAQLLKEFTNCPLGAEINIEKQIPMGAGMGGGSSDAASTLLGLNHLWKTGLNLSELSTLGLKLGADVPFFLHGKNAFVEGIGENITPIQGSNDRYLLIYPGVGIPTMEIFQDPSLTRNHPSITMMDFAAHYADSTKFSNDLQPVVVKKHKEVQLALDWLLMNISGSTPKMSGSGSTVFTPISDQFDANLILSELPKKWTGLVVQGLLEHPAYNLVPSL